MKYSKAHCVSTENSIYSKSPEWNEILKFSEYHRVESNIVSKILMSITLLGCKSEEALETAAYPHPTDTSSYEGTEFR